ncbi:MAG: AAA family ATPase [Alphaproteobacteria bacterium]
MSISIFPHRRGDPPAFETTFALKQDDWNDYSFRTLYHLYHRDADQTQTLIGPVKILRRGQKKGDALQITAPFETLPENFCSVGTSLDYYQRLNEIPTTERDEILAALRDVVANPQLQDQFSSDTGWRTSLFRDDPNPEYFLADAEAIYSKNYSELIDLHGTLRFRPTNWNTPLELNFDAPDPLFFGIPLYRSRSRDSANLIPRRVIVLIGRNGSGKSTILSNIARVAFASTSDRMQSELQTIGTFEPSSVGFPRVIAISYSAFDNFAVPGLHPTERRQIATDIEKGGGRYVYVGLRDIVTELREDLENAGFLEQQDQRRSQQRSDLRVKTHLKPLQQLADEFSRFVQKIAENDDTELFELVLRSLLSDSSFGDAEGDALESLIGNDAGSAFLNWSTGHKIALHVVAALVATATRRSLVLFDEPEMHLHPPLIAALMHAVRLVLEKKDAFAIVATHSPVILQETLARHVRVIRRDGESFSVKSPNMETFGENVGVLTYDTFGLTAAATDFHHVLDLLIERFDNLEEINEVFTPGLSGQALAYVMAGLARKKRQE